MWLGIVLHGFSCVMWNSLRSVTWSGFALHGGLCDASWHCLLLLTRVVDGDVFGGRCVGGGGRHSKFL